MRTLIASCVLAVLGALFYFESADNRVAFAQSASSTAPDCQFSTRLTGVSSSPAFPNISSTSGTPCVFWRITYTPNGFSAVTLNFQGARDVNGVAGTFVTVPTANILEGANPLTDPSCAPGGSGCTLVARIYTPWIRINVSAVTGTGSIQVRGFGYRGTNPAASSATGSNVTITGPLGQATMAASIPVVIASNQSPVGVAEICTNQAEVALSGTGYTSIVAGSGATVIRICKLLVTSSSGGNPTVNTFTAAFGVCAGAPTEAFNAAGVTGLDSDFGAALRSGAGGALCVKEANANSDKVTVTYVQN